MSTKEDILKLFEEYPTLNAGGLGFPYRVKQVDKDMYIEENQKELLNSIDEVEFVIKTLERFGETTKTLNRKYSSYGLKHIVERLSGAPRGYIRNGAFIAGALLSGYKITTEFYNPSFNISTRSVKRMMQGF